MENVVLAGRDALAFLLSPQVKQLDEDFETSLYITRSNNNFMAYLPDSIDYTPLLASVVDPPCISKKESQQLAQQLSTNTPLTVMVPSDKSRRNSARLKCLIAPMGFSGDTCFQVSPGLFCALPELALAQVAKDLTDLQLIVLMSLLFGVFSKSRETGELTPRRSVSSPEKVAAFIARCKSDCAKTPKGMQRIEKLLPLAICKAASPMEIECAIRLGFEIERGGCAFGAPEMNYKLGIPSTRRSRYVDLYWPEQNVGVEYKGAAEHGTLDALEADALRDNDLTSIGVPIFTITAGQINDLTAFNRVARQIETKLHAYKKRYARKTARSKFPSSAEFHNAQRRLKAELDEAFRMFGF